MSGGTGNGKYKKFTGADPNHKDQQPSRHGKEKAGTIKSKKAKELDRMRAECVTYPSWERYVVKRAD